MSEREKSGHILVVDDERANRDLLRGMLDVLGHQCETVGDGTEALEKLDGTVDAVLLDVMMPDLDGFETATRIRDDPSYADLPIIMVTGLEGRDVRLNAVRSGANDFISKPFDMTELRVRLESQLELKWTRDELKRHEAELEQMVEKRTRELQAALDDLVAAEKQTRAAHLDTIRRLVLAAEYKDEDTAAHIQRIAEYCTLLAEAIGLPAETVELIRHASPMHDVGKLGIPDRILLKPGKLAAEEREIIEQHATIGARLLAGSPSELLQAGEIIALSHHERWDGAGYPQQQRGEEIPLFGRICAIADVFDALTTSRPYRTALSMEDTVAHMRDQRGKHFDPDLLDAFLDNLDHAKEIHQAVRDTPRDEGVDELSADAAEWLAAGNRYAPASE